MKEAEKHDQLHMSFVDENGKPVSLDDALDDSPYGDMICRMQSRATAINECGVSVHAADSAFGKCTMVPDEKSVCGICIHHNSAKPWTCKAFPDAIPVEILLGDEAHLDPVKGDHGLTFEPPGLNDDGLDP